MNLKLLSPAKSLNPGYLKQDLNQVQIDTLKTALKALFDRIDEQESEENLKNIVSDFLKDTYYKNKYEINTKGRDDLVIRAGTTIKDDVGVIMEFKKPKEVADMISKTNPNVKALHELILYYLNETIIYGEHEVKHLIATNGWDWYIFDGAWFEKHIYDNTFLRKDYENWRVSNTSTQHFYEFIAHKHIATLRDEVQCTYINLKSYKAIIENGVDDENLIDLYKILSPEHLLKKPFANDSNTLNTGFYNELLYIIGLEEIHTGSKRLIERKKESEREEGSFIENTITALKRQKRFGYDEDEESERKYFDLALELCITWLNRILFLKLLEGQLVKYHPTDKEKFLFLHKEMITSYSDLDELFFDVLAVTKEDRDASVKKKYGNIPYLNSSLFEPTDHEKQYQSINQLKDRLEMPIFLNTVFKNDRGNRVTGSRPTLQYLFDFLNAYNFASDSSAKIQLQNKTLINASVLGLIFEKINGYKDGSFFTPSFITMYMCREVVRKAVIKKFNDNNKWNCDTIEGLKDKIEYTDKKERQKANNIVNSITICDPAVGSGHFLVSALNELIAIKNELGILSYHHDNSRVQGWKMEIANDELIIADKDTDKIYNYSLNQNGNPISDLQNLQETLFHEKQKLIEGCLFGVDINPKSVLICRLRLWIELLKNSYYTQKSSYLHLETLPNIDINIKPGNSLMSRFAIDDRNNIIPKDRPVIKQLIERYKILVDEYKNAPDKRAKDDYRRQIEYIKNELQKFIFIKDKDYLQLKKKEAELLQKQSEINFSGEAERKIWGEQINTMAQEAYELKTAYEQKMKSLYSNALEWRFEFPEILDKEGIFEGFDIIIGNPPYIKEYDKREVFDGLRDKECYQGKMDIWYLFGDLGLKLLKPDSYLCFIATNNWVTNSGASNFRNIVIANSKIENLTDFGAYMIFDSASIQTMIMLFKNTSADNYSFDYRCLSGKNITKENVLSLLQKVPSENSLLLSPVINKKQYKNKPLLFNTDENEATLKKIKAKQNFSLREKADKKKGLKSEVGQGIVAPQDFVNTDSAELLNGSARVGDGIFVLSDEEYQMNDFSATEKAIIKPYYTTEQLHKYYGSNKNTHWLIYTKSDIDVPDKVSKRIPIDNYPKIKAHLEKYEDVITSSYAPYGLHRSREKHLFEGEKIMALRKCPTEPIFTYTDFDCYVSQTFFVIQSDRINLKYLTGLLNSRLIEFWLRRKGKMQGNSYQLDKEPLLQIPIYKPSDAEMESVASLVDEIIAGKAGGGKPINLRKLPLTS